jgi:hypothetical protein
LISAQLQLAQAEDAQAREIDAEAAERELALARVNLAQAQLQWDELLSWAPDELAVEACRTRDPVSHRLNSPVKASTGIRIFSQSILNNT